MRTLLIPDSAGVRGGMRDAGRLSGKDTARRDAQAD